MTNKLFLIMWVAVPAIVGIFYFNFYTANSITNFPSNGSDIIAFGDSLVEGVGATSGNDFVGLLSKKIGKPIINLGVAGDTTEDGLLRIREFDKYNPKVVLLLLGGNDHLKKMPIEKTFQNLSLLIENIQARGAIVLLLGVRGNLLGDKFKAEFEKLHKKYRTAYVSDVLDGLFGNAAFMEDVIHPNDKGYAVIAERIYPVLLPLTR